MNKCLSILKSFLHAGVRGLLILSLILPSATVLVYPIRTIADSPCIADPSGAGAGAVDTGGIDQADADDHTYRVYAYRVVNGTRYYSNSYSEATQAGFEAGGPYHIDVGWSEVAGATGYRTLVSNTYRGYAFDYYYDVEGSTSFADNNDVWSSGGTVTPNGDCTLLYPATVTNVSSTATNGSYAGGGFSIVITFSESVDVDTGGGVPRILLETGSTDNYATYNGGSGSVDLYFDYNITATDNTSDLDYFNTTSLESNGGTIKNTSDGTTDATLTLPSPGTSGSLGANKDIVLDTTAPTFSSVSPSSSSYINNVTDNSDINFIISEDLAAATTTITRTGGTADGNSPHVCTHTGNALLYGESGYISLDLSDTSNSCTSNVSNLVSGTMYTINFSGRDTVGIYATDVTRTNVTFDNTAPTVSNVTSDKTNGLYKAGEVIDIDVTFSEAVTSSGNVTVTLETGTTDRTCTFSVSSATTGTCNYTVQSGDTSSDLTVNSVSGTITDAAGNSLSNTTPTTNLAANKALVIDAVAPTSFTTGSVTTVGGYVASGKWNSTNTSVDIVVPVANDSSLTGGTIQLQAEADGAYANVGSSYTILVGDLNTNKTMSLSAAIFEAISGFSEGDNVQFRAVITDLATNSTTGTASATSLDIDQTAPTIISVSSDKTAGSYTVGEVIDIDVTFDEIVVSTGVVTVTLETGATDRTCTFSTNGNSAYSCNYTVLSGDTSSDLDATISADTIRDNAGNLLSSYTPTTGLAANEALVIDTTAPVVSVTVPSDSATVSGASVTVTASATDTSGSGVAGVQFKLATNTAIGSEDTGTPFTISWDTTALSDGSQSLTAVARDVAGNYATSTAITVTVDNISAPTVTTSAASALDTTLATLNGNITATGGANSTDRGFAYGLTTEYGATTTLPGSYGVSAFTDDLTGLTCATEYHFRAYATNLSADGNVGYGSDTTFTTSACPSSGGGGGASSGGGGGSGGGSGYVSAPVVSVPIIAPVVPPTNTTITNIIDDLIPDFLKRDTEIDLTPKISEVPEIPQLTLKGEWELIPNSTIDKFILSNLPPQLAELAIKFPGLEKVFNSIGIKKVTDLNKLADASINLPLVRDSKNIPTELLFARLNGDVNVTTSLNLNERGDVEQQISTLGGKTLHLFVRPAGATENVKGYLTFKKSAYKTVVSMPANSMVASALLSIGGLAKKVVEPTRIEEKLLVDSFEYTDPDKDGVYSAEIQTPKVEGEYEVVTVINYTDKKKGSTELRMVTVIDPEGYVYEKNGAGREIRLDGAIVSIYKMTQTGNILWNAKEYLQENPQVTDQTGRYSFLVPEGSYYITASLSGYDLYQSDAFTVSEGNSVHFNIELNKKNSWLNGLVDWKFGIILLFIAIFVTHLIDIRRKK